MIWNHWHFWFSRSIAIDESLVLTAPDGEKMDLNGIKPTKSQRSIFDKMDIDGVIHEHENPISSGQLSFREVFQFNFYPDVNPAI